MAHVCWALSRVTIVLNNDTITSTNSRDKATVLVMPYYRA